MDLRTWALSRTAIVFLYHLSPSLHLLPCWQTKKPCLMTPFKFRPSCWWVAEPICFSLKLWKTPHMSAPPGLSSSLLIFSPLPATQLYNLPLITCIPGHPTWSLQFWSPWHTYSVSLWDPWKPRCLHPFMDETLWPVSYFHRKCTRSHFFSSILHTHHCSVTSGQATSSPMPVASTDRDQVSTAGVSKPPHAELFWCKT